MAEFNILFMKKAKVGIEENILSVLKGIHGNLIANIILSSQRLETLSLSDEDQGKDVCSHASYSTSYC